MLSEFPASHLDACLAEDVDRADAIVAMSGSADRNAEVIGLGTLVPSVEGGLAQVELGMLVHDDWQGLGVGTMLLMQLLHRAGRRSVRTVEAQVLNTQQWSILWLRDHMRVIQMRTTRETTAIVFEIDSVD